MVGPFMIEYLLEFGLTETQAKVYVLLLRYGKTSAPNITKRMKVHRREGYRVLRELVEKRIVTESKNSRPVMFSALAPKDALNSLLERQANRLEHLKKNMPRLVEWLNPQVRRDMVGPSILLIDDDEMVRKVLKGALVKEGFKVDTVPDGKTARKRSKRFHYDAALLDVRLPDVDGINLIKSLREGNPDLKEIIITGYPSFENATRALDEGANAFVTKPIKPIELIAKIKEKLDT